MTNLELIDVVIDKREVHSDDIVILDLVSKDGKPLPPFEAGAHVDVHITGGIIRQYSLAGDPAENSRYRLGILNDPNSRGGSAAVFEMFLPGKTITISSPKNLFPLQQSATKSILIAGGIGITPILSMAYALKAAGKPFEVHYCLRNESAGGFKQELRENFGENVHFHFNNESGLTSMKPQDVLQPVDANTHMYVCGPTGFLDWVLTQAAEVGYQSHQRHYEFFSAEVDTQGDAFEVHCAKSQIDIKVLEGESIATALKKAGIKVSMSCEEGVCGTCITDVLDGTPDHRDHFLTDEEKEDNDQIAVCCSRSLTPSITLDI
ncbi:MAG: PDR/VanB family oxidoreductase [Pseudomonadota bacterium]|nr:PDR/VanB family oxidoreductase [Pseudomonadota bacterium]